jgi:hypothetical protein
VGREDNQVISETVEKSDKFTSKDEGKSSEELKAVPGLCKKCGKVGAQV